jgi:hypothetical protein
VILEKYMLFNSQIPSPIPDPLNSLPVVLSYVALSVVRRLQQIIISYWPELSSLRKMHAASAYWKAKPDSEDVALLRLR